MEFNRNNVITNIDNEKAIKLVGSQGYFADDMRTLKNAVENDSTSLRSMLISFDTYHFINNVGISFSLFYPLVGETTTKYERFKNNFKYNQFNGYEPRIELKSTILVIPRFYLDIVNDNDAKRLLALLQSKIDTIKYLNLHDLNKRLVESKTFNDYTEMCYHIGRLSQTLIKIVMSDPKMQSIVRMQYRYMIKHQLTDMIHDYHVIKGLYKLLNALIYNKTKVEK